MTARQFPDEWYRKPFSWRMGFISGGWISSKTDKEPPTNPCAQGSVWWEEWQDGFETRKKLLREGG